ncbi:MAG: CRISPR-associated protein Cas4 [Dehalococcoidales bacterium]|nr:CRISPR-associated protein Cas4 [Dehalococcoidales bacterium]
MTFTEDDLLPISALQHLAFCPRQWALIHLEGQWIDNRFTAEGILAHERVHSDETENRGVLRISRGLRLRSLRLGLVGQADVVEFHKTVDPSRGIRLEGTEGYWQPFIIEYKHGRPKIGHEDEVQLCAQALCLEEMLGAALASASFFYGQPRRRHEVALNHELRNETETLIAIMHELTRSGRTPAPDYSARCRSCSLVDICLPKTSRGKQSVSQYLAGAIRTEGEQP